MKCWATGFVVLALAMMVSGCGEKLTAKNLERVKKGMTQEEVKSILGNYNRLATASSVGLHGRAWIYQKGATKATISFVNDVVIYKEGTFQ